MPYFTLEDGAVILDPDVRAYFPSSGCFNQALRSLIAPKPSNRQNRRQLLSRGKKTPSQGKSRTLKAKGGRRGAVPPGGLMEKAGMAFCWKAAIELG
jgi:hypothetical protein